MCYLPDLRRKVGLEDFRVRIKVAEWSSVVAGMQDRDGRCRGVAPSRAVRSHSAGSVTFELGTCWIGSSDLNVFIFQYFQLLNSLCFENSLVVFIFTFGFFLVHPDFDDTSTLHTHTTAQNTYWARWNILPLDNMLNNSVFQEVGGVTPPRKPPRLTSPRSCQAAVP